MDTEKAAIEQGRSHRVTEIGAGTVTETATTNSVTKRSLSDRNRIRDKRKL